MEPKNNNKRTYAKPRIKKIKLDNEISLVMQSPAGNPSWSKNETLNNDKNPFKNEDSYC